MLEKTLECLLDYKEIKPVKPKGNQCWIFIERTDSEIEVPMFWPPNAKNWLIIKDPDGGKDWKQKKKGMTQDEMVEWHDQLNGHEFEQALRNGEGWGNLVCCSPWCCKKSDMTEWLNNNKEACVRFLILWTGDRKKKKNNKHTPGSCSDGQGLAL